MLASALISSLVPIIGVAITAFCANAGPTAIMLDTATIRPHALFPVFIIIYASRQCLIASRRHDPCRHLCSITDQPWLNKLDCTEFIETRAELALQGVAHCYMVATQLIGDWCGAASIVKNGQIGKHNNEVRKRLFPHATG
jgi:hypothetical protein